MVNEHNVYNVALVNGSSTHHLYNASVATPTNNLVAIDADSGGVSNSLNMGQAVAQNDLLSFHKLPIKSILKKTKVYDSSNESLLTRPQLRQGILKKDSTRSPVISNGGGVLPWSVSTSAVQNHMTATAAITSNVVANENSGQYASAKSAVQFKLDSTSRQPHSANLSTTSSSDTAAAMSTTTTTTTTTTNTTTTTTTTTTTSVSSVPRMTSTTSSSKAGTSFQSLSANHLQVPPHQASALLKSSAAYSVANSSQNSNLSTTTGAQTTLSTTSSSQGYNLQPSYYTGTTAQRMSDLRKILNPEVEKEDSFKKFTEAIENCDCFEFNLNNAAKLITVLVLLATLVLVIRALKGDR